MTEMQIRFLRVLTAEPRTVEEICREMNIKPEQFNPDGGYLVALKDAIPLDVGDECDPLYGLYDFLNSQENRYNEDRFYITRKGKEYLEEYDKQQGSKSK